MPTDPSARQLKFRAALRSDVGTVRENNEDAAYAREDFLVLADGMGGHSSGEVASSIAVHTFARAADSLHHAAEHTREVLRHMSAVDETLHTMGTTVVALRATGGEFHVCHIGDSRLYRLRGGELSQITTDHTHVQHLVEQGRIKPEQVATHPFRAMLLKSLDDQPGGSEPDIFTIDLHEGDRVLLCSDGLSDYVPEHAIREDLNLPAPEEAAEALVASAVSAGTRDNITVIVADVVTGSGTAPTFAGAASDPMTVSPEARRALFDAAPNFAGTVATPGPVSSESAGGRAAGRPPGRRSGRDGAGHRERDGAGRAGGGAAQSPSETGQASPSGGRTEQAGRRAHASRAPTPLAGILAACAVVVVGVAIALLL